MFCPTGPGAASSISTTATLIALPATQLGNSAVRVRLSGSLTGYLKFGDSSVVATTNDMAQLGGESEDYLVPIGATNVSILATTSGSVSITAGYKG